MVDSSSEDRVADLLGLGLGLAMLLRCSEQSGEEQFRLDCLELEIEVATATDSYSTNTVVDLTGLDLVTMESPGLVS